MGPTINPMKGRPSKIKPVLMCPLAPIMQVLASGESGQFAPRPAILGQFPKLIEQKLARKQLSLQMID